MMLNIKAQVEFKVKPGTKSQMGQAMIDQLGDEVSQMIEEFMASRGLTPQYQLEVKESYSLMRF